VSRRAAVVSKSAEKWPFSSSHYRDLFDQFLCARAPLFTPAAAATRLSRLRASNGCCRLLHAAVVVEIARRACSLAGPAFFARESLTAPGSALSRTLHAHLFASPRTVRPSPHPAAPRARLQRACASFCAPFAPCPLPCAGAALPWPSRGLPPHSLPPDRQPRCADSLPAAHRARGRAFIFLHPSARGLFRAAAARARPQPATPAPSTPPTAAACSS